MEYARKLQHLWNELEKGDEEAIHDARKLTRKAQAYLRGIQAPRKAQKPWRKLRRAIAPIRDLDVTLVHLKQLLRDQRADGVTLELLALHFSTQRLRLWSGVELPDRPQDVPPPKDWKELVQETLDDDWSSLKREARKVLKSEDPVAWHSWRKHLKRYRYTWELLEEAPKELLALLQHLGTMQDMEVLRAELQHAPEFLHPYRPELLEVLGHKHHEEQRQARELWHAWSKSHAVLIES